MEGDVEKYCLIPTLAHITSVNIVVPYLKHPAVVNKLQQYFNHCRCSALFFEFCEDIYYNFKGDIIAEIITVMDDCLKELPKRIVMELLDKIFLIGSAFFWWVFVHNNLYDKQMICISEKIKRVNFVHYLDCIVWTSLGIIDYKKSAKLLCRRPGLSIIHRYVIACNYALIEEKDRISSTTNLSLILKSNVAQEYPMVALFTSNMKHHLIESGDDDDEDDHSQFNCEERAFYSLICGSGPRKYSYDAAVQFLWNSFSKEQKLRHLPTVIEYFPSTLSIYYVLSEMKKEHVKIDYESHGEMILLGELDSLLFEDRFLNSCAYILPKIQSSAFKRLLNKLVCLIKYDDTLYFVNWNFPLYNVMYTSFSGSSYLNKMICDLIEKSKSNTTTNLNQLLQQYYHYRSNKYKMMLKELCKCIPDLRKREIFKLEDDGVSVFMLCLLTLLPENCIDLLSSVLKSLRNDEKIVLINAKGVAHECASLVINKQSSLLEKFISIYFSQESDMNNFKIKCFRDTFKGIVIECITRNDKQLIDNLNIFVNFFRNVVPTEEMRDRKLDLLSDSKVIDKLFKTAFLYDSATLDYYLLNNFFKWCCDIDDKELGELKMNLFKISRFDHSFFQFVCDLKDDYYSRGEFSNAIFNWCADKDSHKLELIEEDFKAKYLLYNSVNCTSKHNTGDNSL